MTTIEQSIYQEIKEKLKDAPKNVLERVLGYVDGVLEMGDEENFQDLKMQVHEDYASYKTGKSPLIDVDEAEKAIENSISKK
ncbi:hypothetical protein [Chryseobacterium sp. Leaf394]|uniref:hypothetical protein n=1 Tax=Chryseobacterium sp. Leaf394 TaxID=1736361 RepID=UPI0006F45936|nr:hypothetical protein [Chryseobacterium sp. Leaf394]KQS91484.1 hypothetical protein ASG21_03155 [Chryseobacterium sp. Leaf394]